MEDPNVIAGMLEALWAFLYFLAAVLAIVLGIAIAGHIFYRMGRYRSALTYLRVFGRIAGTQSKPQAWIARTYRKLHDREAAIAYYKQAIFREPFRFPEMYLELAAVQKEAGRKSDAQLTLNMLLFFSQGVEDEYTVRADRALRDLEEDANNRNAEDVAAKENYR